VLAEDRAAARFARLPDGAQIATLIVLVGLLLFLALLLESSGETAFLYATF
jgi:hypothetical protein